MGRDPNRPAVQAALDRLLDPEHGVGGELVAATPIELRQARIASASPPGRCRRGRARAALVAARELDHQAQVGVDQLLLGGCRPSRSASRARSPRARSERVLHRGVDEELEAVRGRLGGRAIARPAPVGASLCSFVVVLAALAARLAAVAAAPLLRGMVLSYLSLPCRGMSLCRAFSWEPPPAWGPLTLQKVYSADVGFLQVRREKRRICSRMVSTCARAKCLNTQEAWAADGSMDAEPCRDRRLRLLQRRRPPARRADSARAGGRARRGGEFVWIGLHEPRQGDLDQPRQPFGLHELAVEDAARPHQRPKSEEYDESSFIVLRTAHYHEDTEVVHFGEIHVFAGPGYDHRLPRAR